MRLAHSLPVWRKGSMRPLIAAAPWAVLAIFALWRLAR